MKEKLEISFMVNNSSLTFEFHYDVKELHNFHTRDLKMKI